MTGKITIYRTVLQIVGDIDLEKHNLKSKLIVPLDEYLGIDKLPFKASFIIRKKSVLLKSMVPVIASSA